MFPQFRSHIVFDKDGDGGASGAATAAEAAAKKDDPPAGGGAGDDGKSKTGPQSIADFIKSLPADQQSVVQGLYDSDVKGLKTALDGERTTRETKEKELRTLAKAAGENTELKAKLEKMADEVADEGRRADFYDEAHAQGVTNLKLAYRIAVDDELIGKTGRVAWDTLKADYPELFTGKAKPRGNAGQGWQGGEPGPKDDMNSKIRKAAGRPS